MSELQYFWGWVVYLTGAIGCLLSLWFIVRKWHPRVKRPLMMAFAVLFFLPGTIHPEQSFLGPAFLISLYDGLSQGIEAMWRTGQAVAIIAGVAAITGVLLPVAKATVTRDKRQKARTGKTSHAQRQRKEPAC
ncbi:hypothetical protein [Endozoicomonas atrinae]|nr:hypothetical protein [Endozoicomonas atrinae]